MRWLVLRVRFQGDGCVDRCAVRGLRVDVALRGSLPLRLGGGGRGMGALTGAAAGVCAGTRLLHLPPLG